MKRYVFVFALGLLVVPLISGCDSDQVSEPTKTEPTAKSEPAAPAEPAMETPQPASEPVALSASDEAVGAGHNNEGVGHYEQGHWDVAQEHFQKAVAENGNLAEAHYNLALTLDKLGNHGEATNHFKMALDLAPDNPSIKDSGILKAHVGG